MPQSDPARLRRLADAAWREAEAAINRGDVAAATAAKTKALFWETAHREAQQLHTRVHSVKNRRMDANTDAPRRPGRKTSRQSIVKAEADRRGMSLFELAQAMGLPYTTIKSWHTRGVPADKRHLFPA